MPIDRTGLLGFLEAVDKELKRPITIVAVGGTAMTLLGLKTSTIDIDFDLPTEYFSEFKKTASSIPHGYRLDLYRGGMIFSQQLPSDYIEKSIAIKTKLKNISLRALHPVDIVVTKAGRLDSRDTQDIEACIREYKLTADQIRKRSEAVQYAGREESYADNMRHVLKTFFQEK
ncbi:MAG: DUF6036 family nucleotidyltransferase [Candidatus Aenigmatarchaeota archaeon]